MQTQLKMYSFIKNILSAYSEEWEKKTATKTDKVGTLTKLTFKPGRQKIKKKRNFGFL